MADDTKISWTNATWNPIRGCSRVSEGCRHCYAEGVAARFSGPGQPYEGLATRKLRVISDDEQRVEARWTGAVRFLPEMLFIPASWKRPRTIFVNSMADLFHERVTEVQIAAVFGAMALAPQHVFQTLTKRASRMRAWFEWFDFRSNTTSPGDVLSSCLEEAAPGVLDEDHHNALVNVVNGYARWRGAPDDGKPLDGRLPRWPLPHVWLGVSTEDQATADERIPLLLECPAAVRWISAEPLLGPIGLVRGLAGAVARRIFRENGGRDGATIPLHLRPPPHLNWVVAGCESGPVRRACDVAWLRSLRDQCRDADVPFFLKQATAQGGEWTDHPPVIGEKPGVSRRKQRVIIELPALDGVVHDAMPEVRRG